VTDANLLLGRLPERLAGGVELDRDAAERAMGSLDPAAVVDVVNAEMLRALRVVSVERGLDPRDFALVAFGGAGPLHACALAEELGIRDVLVPDAAGVLSAVGLVASDERRDRVESRLVPLDEAGELPRDGEADLRVRGPVVRADRPAGGRPRGRLPPCARGAVRLRRSRAADRARRDPHRRRAPRPVVRPAARRGAAGRRPARPRATRLTVFVPPGWVGVRDGSSTLRVTRA
jgi:hypothetical protein